MWLGSSVIRVLARSAFESRLGHVLLSPLSFGVSVLGLQAAKGLSRLFRVATGTNPGNAPVICNHRAEDQIAGF